MDLKSELKRFFKGEVSDDSAALDVASRDASLLSVRPEVVVAPEDVTDVKNLVAWVAKVKRESPSTGSGRISLTARSGGTDMTGGPLNESIIVDFSKHFQKVVSIDAEKKEATVLPGTYYRDFEKATLEKGLIMPSYPASREICTVGGMVANNAGGEKSLRYGKTENFVKRLKVVLADGLEHEIRALSRDEVFKKMDTHDLEGDIYREMYRLITENEEIIKRAKPNVSKNSAGYYLWNVYNGQTFDLTKLFVGSQGTLGLVTEITFGLVPVKPVSKLLVIFIRDLSILSKLTNTILPFNPESLEVYDDATLKLAIRFFPDLLRVMKTKHLIRLILGFIPEFFMMLRGGFPKLVLLAEVVGDTEQEVDAKLKEMNRAVADYHLPTRITKTEEEAKSFWTIRRESFNLLRKHVHGKRTAPFIDDVVVRPEFLPDFLPKLRAILDEYKLYYTIAGHDGNGNLHIIPLMNMKEKHNKEIIPEISEKVYDLVAQFGGSITAEHNDGLIRTPYLGKMYSPEILKLFEKTKKIFDPQGIFNPGKKVGGSLQYTLSHISTS